MATLYRALSFALIGAGMGFVYVLLHILTVHEFDLFLLLCAIPFGAIFGGGVLWLTVAGKSLSERQLQRRQARQLEAKCQSQAGSPFRWWD